MLNEKKGKNSALYCFMCDSSVQDACQSGKMVFRNNPESKKNYAVCEDCIADFYTILEQSRPEFVENRKPLRVEEIIGKHPTPKQIYGELNKYIMGQDKAKRSISIALANHFQRTYDSSIQKSNVLLVGPTGTGKTEIARTAARILDVPFVVADATTFTARGYVGEDVESVLTRLLQAADLNLERAQCGIVFIDEIDKLAEQDNTYIGTLAVQQSLLKIVEGAVFNVPKQAKAKGASSAEIISFDTSKVLFICAGAFSGLEKILADEKREGRTMGLGLGSQILTTDKVEDAYQNVSHKHLVKYGIIPEFLGRFQIITNTNSLDVADLARILTEPVNSMICQYKKLLSKYDVEIEFSKEFIDGIAIEAKTTGMGARGLKAILEKRLETILFEAPDYEKDKKKFTL